MSRKLVYRELYTKRLILRDVKQSDYQPQLEYLSDKANFPYADYKQLTTFHEVKQFFNKILEYQNKGSSLFWMICLRETDQPIGTVSAWNVDWNRNSIEFGYSIYPAFREHGYMSEALQAVMTYCNETLGFTILDIWTEEHNLPSQKLAEKLGFRFMGYEIEQAKHSPGDIKYAMYKKNV
jgi:[ribosomal protein S5]-alanine N-acetyltransferase